MAGPDVLDVLKLMSAIATAENLATGMAFNANSVYETVTAVADQSRKTILELEKEASSIEQREVSEFRDCLRETEATGHSLSERCFDLSKLWQELKLYVDESLNRPRISQEVVRGCIRLLQLMLQCAAECHSSYQEFRMKLNHVVDVGSKLAQQCKVAAANAASEASDTRFVGYGTAGSLGAIAVAFLTFATGTLALVAAAATGVAAAGLGSHTTGRAGRLDKLANVFDGLRAQLKVALEELNRLGDSVSGLVAVTTKIEGSMEIALKIFSEQRRILQENSELQTRILELEVAARNTGSEF